MATNFNKALYNSIKEKGKLITTNERTIENIRLQSKCECVHRDLNNSFSLIPPKGGQNAKKSEFTGAPMYRCKTCEQWIDLSAIPEERLRASIDCICNLLHVSKMKLDPNSDKDEKTRKKIAKLLFRLQTLVPDLYRTLDKNKRKNKNRKSNGGGDNIMRIG